jgi:hypothetical protein
MSSGRRVVERRVSALACFVPDCPEIAPEADGEHRKNLEIADFIGDPGRIRTCDPLIRNQVLYPLSYGANEPCRALNDGAVPPSTHSQFDPTAGLLACSIGTKKRQGRAVTFTLAGACRPRRTPQRCSHRSRFDL